MLLENGFGEVDDMLSDVPDGNGHGRQYEEAANQDQLIASGEAILDGVHYQQWDHNDGKDRIGEDEQWPYPDAPLLTEASQRVIPAHSGQGGIWRSPASTSSFPNAGSCSSGSPERSP